MQSTRIQTIQTTPHALQFFATIKLLATAQFSHRATGLAHLPLLRHRGLDFDLAEPVYGKAGSCCVAGSSSPAARSRSKSARDMRTSALPEASWAVTGIAGPGGSEFKPEGRVCFGIARSGAETRTKTIEFGAIGRGPVRTAARDHALALLSQAITAR